ncbi:nucleotidyltransferase domain-containing protein [Anoxynatronum sibiricum]|uniref:Nucleotidyltransferase domain-containing protein n=1 Tax=Anoxynatronum sibiricum TaxID=210623 RepID=A0ABU9VXX2_9CLOT
MNGLLDRDLNFIIEAVDKYSEIEEVILFGSRAMGNYKKGSDVDLAIVGENIDRKILRRISDDLNEEYPLPYFFDVLNYNDISNEALKKHIDSVGKSIYKRNSKK